MRSTPVVIVLAALTVVAGAVLAWSVVARADLIVSLGVGGVDRLRALAFGTTLVLGLATLVTRLGSRRSRVGGALSAPAPARVLPDLRPITALAADLRKVGAPATNRAAEQLTTLADRFGRLAKLPENPMADRLFERAAEQMSENARAVKRFVIADDSGGARPLLASNDALLTHTKSALSALASLGAPGCGEGQVRSLLQGLESQVEEHRWLETQ